MLVSRDTLESAERLDVWAKRREALADSAHSKLRNRQFLGAAGDFTLNLLAKIPESVRKSGFRSHASTDEAVGVTSQLVITCEATDAANERLFVTDEGLALRLGVPKGQMIPEVQLARTVLADSAA
ncbi:MAG TPA: hypothetical protein VFW77_02915 [Candidatus Saccharimonadales bacterium]|nr:hypothetical protein [Candidatus Saccharimonadales bacterium]